MWLPYPILFRYSDTGIAPSGLPHSAIQGSQDMCSFPWLFAAYHGLLRLVAPRHPPYTYCSLDHIIVSSHFTARPPGSPFRLQAHATSQACRAGIPHAPFSVHESYLLQIRVPSFDLRGSSYPFPRLVKYRVRFDDSAFRLFVYCAFNGPIIELVGLGLIRVELMTPSLSEKCSNRLSYRPV